MYHYTMSGLKRVWLRNGYRVRKTPEGDAVAISDIDGLHRAIASHLVHNKPFLTGPELRFLRTEMCLSQSNLARLLGKEVQAVARWEKTGRVLKMADRFVRALWLAKNDGNETIITLIERLEDMDQQADEDLRFEDTKDGWREAA
ncbi:helix-turn-helix domain-containing protein [Dongia sp.]|uniref:helix-turn-helix domain-containing protein n=1 Tax=Dongia sp. TaxID=1977262 RepID=UPI0035B10919